MKVRSEARRSAIIATAAELFKEAGYERASMNELAKRLGGSKATLYNYFSSKEELLVAVVQAYATGHLAEAMTSLTTERQSENLKTVLLRFGESMLVVLTNDGEALSIYRMIIAEASHSDVGMLFYRSGPSQCIEALAKLLAQAMAQGEIADADPQLRALQFLSLLTAETELRLYQRQPQPLERHQIRQLVNNAVEMFMAGALVGIVK